MWSTLPRAVAIAAAIMIAAGPTVSPVALAQGTLTAQPGQPSNPSPGSHPGQQKLSQQDRDFVQKLAKGGMMQIELGKVAAKQTDNPKIREFAVDTIASLGKAGGMLHALAKQAGMQLPTEPPDDVKKLKRALAETEGDTLNREYVALILPASTVAVNVFEEEAEDGQDPKFVNFAKQMLPKIRQHQQMAENLSQNMGGAEANRPVAPPWIGSSAPPSVPASPQR